MRPCAATPPVIANEFPIPGGLESEDSAGMLCVDLIELGPLIRNGAGLSKKVGVLGMGVLVSGFPTLVVYCSTQLVVYCSTHSLFDFFHLRIDAFYSTKTLTFDVHRATT
jgi:hypothetical protein